jgi:hypothetical protein
VATSTPEENEAGAMSKDLYFVLYGDTPVRSVNDRHEVYVNGKWKRTNQILDWVIGENPNLDHVNKAEFDRLLAGASPGSLSTRQGGQDFRVNREGRSDANATAHRLVADATRREPELTSTVQCLADAHGGQLEGLDHRVKTADSLARKLAVDSADSGKPPAELGDLMFDVNRYTMTADETRYAAIAQAAIDDLRGQGNTVRVKNFWNDPDNPYQGVNLQVTTGDGVKYELQINTPASLAVKNGPMHVLYEKATRRAR